MTAAISMWDEPDLAPNLGERIAGDLRALAQTFEEGSERSQQTDIGPSQVGMPCTRCLARHALGCPIRRAFDDPWCRIIGTAVHSWLEDAALWANAQAGRTRWRTETRVYPSPALLPKGGSSDLYDTDTFTVVDHKIVGLDRLKAYRHNGPGLQYRYQGHIYGLGYLNAGIDVRNVAIAFWPRGGRLKQLYVWTEPFDPQVAVAALERWRLIRDQAHQLGPAILPLLPADPDCWDCGGADV